jgi:excisionase family DNA binding protein
MHVQTSTLINNVSAESLNARLDDIQNDIKELKKSMQPRTSDENLTRKEAASMLKCDISTIHNWTKKGKLIPYKLGNRVYYKRSQIESVMIPF